MNYTIKSKTQNGETITTKVEFTYKGKLVSTEIAHFMPKSEEDIQLGIYNRIQSEKRKIDAEEVASGITLDIDVEKSFTEVPVASIEDNPLSGLTTEELKVQIGILLEEYNTIMAQREAINTLLQDNSSKYDLLIDELAKRV
jgi:hypothetical protein